MTTSPTPTPAPLSEPEFERIATEWSGWPQVTGDPADVPKLIASHRTLTTLLTEWEISADEGYGDSLLGVQITPDWLRARKAEWAEQRRTLTARATQAIAERDAAQAALAAAGAERDRLLDMIDGGQSMRDVAQDQFDRLKATATLLAAAEAREASMREALTTIHELSSGYSAFDLRSSTLRVMSIAQEAHATLSAGAQQAQGGGIARELGAGDVVTCACWDPGETATIKEIVHGTEAVALFTNGGFWRVSQLARAGLITEGGV